MYHLDGRADDFPGNAAACGLNTIREALRDIADLQFPGSGNGMPTSRDGHVLPEFRTENGNPVAMTAGLDAVGDPMTTLRFRFDDGSPYPQTINGQTASDWKLIPDPVDPDRVIWEPHQ